MFSSHSVLDVVEELFEDDFDDVSRKKLNPAHLLGEIFKKYFDTIEDYNNSQSQKCNRKWHQICSNLNDNPNSNEIPLQYTSPYCRIKKYLKSQITLALEGITW